MIALSIAGFICCSALIFYHGTRLSHYGDLIAEKSGLGRAWVGLILMASVTSLPELVIGISSVTTVRSADLATGNVLGSCVFNLAILSLMDALTPGKPLLTRVHGANVLAAALGTILLCLVGIGLFLPAEFVVMDWIGATSVGFLVVYLISIRLLHAYGKKDESSPGPESAGREGASMGMSSVLFWYGVHALVVIAAAIALPYFSDQLAEAYGISRSFVGTLFLAASSSLPEVAVSVSAARMGNVQMGVANLFGSNIFNILMLTVSDMFYLDGYLLKDASDANMVTVFSIIAMNAIAIVGLTIRPEKKRFHFLAWDTLLILVIYVLTMLFVFYNSE